MKEIYSEEEIAYIPKMKRLSNFVYEMSEYIDTTKELNKKTLKDYQRFLLSTASTFPNDDIISPLLHMLSTNRSIQKSFDKDQDKLNKVIDIAFGHCNTVTDINNNLELFISMIKNPDNLDNVLSTSVNKKIKEKEHIADFYKSGVLEPYFIKSRFSKNLEQWKIKEATAWLVTYVENFATPEQLNKNIVMGANGFINKYKTFDNLIVEINKAAITEEPPFKKNNGQLTLNEAKSGEIDVMLWNENKEKIIVCCATRDRGYKIEGNQFFRHFLRAATITEELQSQIKQYKNFVQNSGKVSNNEKQYYLNSEGQPNVNFCRSFIKRYKAEKYHGYLNRQINENMNLLFNTDDSLVRESKNELRSTDYSFSKEFLVERLKQRKDNFTTTSYNKDKNLISGEEVERFLFRNKENVDFVFFGEVLPEKYDQRVLAGLTSLAYRDNFNKIGNLSFDTEASAVFMRNINKRFNNISALDLDVETYGQKHIIDMIKNNDDGNLDFMASDAQFFSKQNTFSEERACLFKAISVMFKTIGESIENLNDQVEEGNLIPSQKAFQEELKKGTKVFFNGKIKKEDINYLEDFVTNKKKVNQFTQQLENHIQFLNSEVPMELTELKSNAKTLSANIRQFKTEEMKYEKELELEEAQKEILEIRKLLAEKDLLIKQQKNDSPSKEKAKDEDNETTKKKRTYYKRKTRNNN